MLIGIGDEHVSLFSSIHSHIYFQQRLISLEEEVNTIIRHGCPDQVESRIEKLRNKYQLTLPRIGEPRLLNHQSIRYTAEDFMTDPNRFLNGPRGALELELPFTGTAELFNVTPSRFSGNRPHGEIHSNFLKLILHSQTESEQEYEYKLENEIFLIKQYLEGLKDDVDSHNQKLAQILHQRIAEQKHAGNRLDAFAKSLGVVVKKAKIQEEPTETEQRKRSRPSLHDLRNIIDELFPSDTDFSAFVLDYFRNIYTQFGDNMNRKRKVTLLLQEVSVDQVVKALRQKEPVRFDHHMRDLGSEQNVEDDK
jgi:hypothetical protein